MSVGMWTEVGGENDIVEGRCSLLIVITETEQRFEENMTIDQALEHLMSLLNPFKMQGKETKFSTDPFHMCVE